MEKIIYTENNPIVCEKKVAIAILGYNSVDYLKNFLPSFYTSDLKDAELIYIDNASNDVSINFVHENFPDIKVFKIEVNRGFTNGYVKSLPFIKAEYYVLINSDVEVSEGWLNPMLAEMEKDKNIAACQPKILAYREKEKFEYSGACGGYIDYLGYPFCRGRIFETIEEDKGQYDEPAEIFWATGACMMVKADVYHKLGGLDNDFYAHMEEIDLCWRINNAGYKIMVFPQAVVYHVGGSIIKYKSFQKSYRNFRNNLIMIYKNLPKNKVWWMIPYRFFLDAVAAYKSLFSGNFSEFRAIVAAHKDFVAYFGKWTKKRKEVQAMKTTEHKATIYNKSIVWQYFAASKKRFSDLGWNVGK